MAARKSSPKRATPQREDPGPDEKTRDTFRQALDAKKARNAKAERTGEDHLNGPGMSLHPNDKQQRTHRRKSG